MFGEWLNHNMSGYELCEKYISDRTKIMITHKECGYSWKVEPRALKLGNRCPRCRRSRGEREISRFLDECDIKYIEQKKYKDCRYKLPLPFDFYLPDYNILIEYQGIQHYKPISAFGGIEGYEKTIHNDNIKRKYCTLKNIPLYHIRYDEDIKQRLKDILTILR